MFEDITLPDNVDEILLFTDGVNTIGNDEIMPTNVPIFSITSSAGSNYNFLKGLCAKTNGEFIDLVDLSQDRALQLLHYDEEGFLSYEYPPHAFKEIYPNVPTRIDDYFEILD